MRHTLLTLFLASLAAGSAVAQGKDDNPFKKAKVGDWVSYTVTSSLMGGNEVRSEMKQTVIEVTDKTVTVKTEIGVGDLTRPAPGAPERKIELSEPLDPAELLASRRPAAAAAFKKGKVDDGTEKVKIGDKTYDCTWTRYAWKQKVKEQDVEFTRKVWAAKDAPLSGLVKDETKSDFFNHTAELSGSGKGK